VEKITGEQLRKEGSNYKMVCPFPDHTEKTPSFIVSQDKGIAHCFGCGQGGPPLKFVMTYTGQSFFESVKEVATIFNIPIPNTHENKKANRLFEAQKLSLEYFQKELKKSANVQDYLKNRGVNKDLVDTFKLGYLDNSQIYLNSLLDEGFSLQELFSVGLINTQNEKSNNPSDYYSPFYERVIFPIFDKWNRLIAFGGRILNDGEPRAKYLNTRDTRFFSKRRNLYGFNMAREHIRKTKKAFVTEGYFDVISAHKVGLNSFVGPLGTSFTEEQAQTIKEVADTVVFVLDPDKAGIDGALRGGKIAFGKGLNVTYKILPRDSDLDDFIRASSDPIDEFNELPETNIIDFYLNTNTDLKNSEFANNPDNLLKVVKGAADLIDYEKNYARKFMWLNKIAESVGDISGKSVSVSTVEASYYNSLDPKVGKKKDILSQRDSDLVFAYIVNLLTVPPNKAKEFVADIPPEFISFDKNLFLLYNLVIDTYVNKKPDGEETSNSFTDNEPDLFSTPVEVINGQDNLFGFDTQKNVSNYVSKLLNKKYGKYIDSTSEYTHPFKIFNVFYNSNKSTLNQTAGILKYRVNLIKRNELINDLISAHAAEDVDSIENIATKINRLGI